MADTGAPFNLRYPLPTDLVKDGADNFKDLADDVAANLSRGLGINVVQTYKVDLFQMSSSTFASVTGLEVTITPSVATSKVLVLAQVPYAMGSAAVAAMRLRRGTTAIAVGTSAGSRSVSTLSAFAGIATVNVSGIAGQTATWTAMFLDSPGVATAVTYDVQVLVSTGTISIGSTRADADEAATFRTTSGITAIEVAV